MLYNPSPPSPSGQSDVYPGREPQSLSHQTLCIPPSPTHTRSLFPLFISLPPLSPYILQKKARRITINTRKCWIDSANSQRISTHTYTNKSTYAHTFLHVHPHVHLHTHTSTFTYTPTRTYIHIHTHTCPHTYTHTPTHTYIHIHTHKYPHTYTHIHTYTYLHTHIFTYAPTHARITCTPTHT